MHGVRILTIVLALAGATAANVTAQADDLEAALRFEGGSGGILLGWTGGPSETVHLDSAILHAGSAALRITRDTTSRGNFSAITRLLPADVAGRRIAIRGWLRTDGVTGFAGLWLRQDGTSGMLAIDNMANRQLRGTTPWTQFTVELPLHADARHLVFGVLLSGQGSVWADDLELLVDGRPLREAPRVERTLTVLETDTAFAGGSGITLASLTAAQTERLTLLAMVWGFLKYHHPRIARGELHWDFELFRILPRVLDAPDDASFRQTIAAWIDDLGVPERCAPCARAPSAPALDAPVDWIRDEALLGPAVSSRLRRIYENRFAGGEQFFVTLTPNVGNAVFANEAAYQTQRPPDAGYRVLALFRLWSMLEYWFPYRDLMPADRRALLREFLPQLVAAHDLDAYRLALIAFIARIRDTHANLWSELNVRPPVGTCAVPVALRFVEDRLVVWDRTDSTVTDSLLPAVGDVIAAIDGRPVTELVAEWEPFYAASNAPTRYRDMARAALQGPCGPVNLTLERDGTRHAFRSVRVTRTPTPLTHDRAGEAFQVLSPEVAYLKLSNVRAQDIPDYLERAAGTRGLIVDIRNYPSEFVVFALGRRLIDQDTPFARFTRGDPSNPGVFVMTPPLTLQPEPPSYGGRVVVIVDEVSQSQAEYTAMALGAGPRAVIIGSTTAGADGNVSTIMLPGAMRSLFSGIGVFHPDGSPTQQVGITPDVEVRPTIAGIRARRDEVLEAAVRLILGADASAEDVRRMTRRLLPSLLQMP